MSKNGRPKALTFDGYQPEGDSLTERVAHALQWARMKYPGAFVSHTILTKAVQGYKRTPTTSSKEVQAVKQACTRARHILLTRHHCSTVSLPALGIRATIDDEDQAKHELPGRVKRVDSARASLRASVDVVDPENIKDQSLKTFATETKRQSLKFDEAMSKIRGLLGPTLTKK